jgi:hypothetical protein
LNEDALEVAEGLDAAAPSGASSELDGMVRQLREVLRALFSEPRSPYDVGVCAKTLVGRFVPGLSDGLPAGAVCGVGAGIWLSAELGMWLAEFLHLRSPEVERVGKRVMVFGRIVGCRDEVVSACMGSLETTGQLWGLRAANKRSAVHAAVQGMLKEMLDLGVEGLVLPGAKSALGRERMRASATGNLNRKRGTAITKQPKKSKTQSHD